MKFFQVIFSIQTLCYSSLICHNKNIIISDSDIAGEGEHKIMYYLNGYKVSYNKYSSSDVVKA